MQSLTILSLTTMLACGGASPPPASSPTGHASPPPVASACAASGDALFEIVHQLGTDPVTPTWSAVVFASGAWQTTDPTAVARTGCLQPAQLALVTTDLDAPWTSVPNQGASCHAVTLAQTLYRVRGKVVWVNRGCSPDHLDDRSAASLARLVDIVTMDSHGGAQPAS